MRNRKSGLDRELQQYTGEWVLIEFKRLDKDLNVVGGKVVAHSPNKDEMYKRQLELKGQNLAIEFVGQPPQDLAVMF
jgi:hypothetical protein